MHVTSGNDHVAERLPLRAIPRIVSELHRLRVRLGYNDDLLGRRGKFHLLTDARPAPLVRRLHWQRELTPVVGTGNQFRAERAIVVVVIRGARHAIGRPFEPLPLLISAPVESQHAATY